MIVVSQVPQSAYRIASLELKMLRNDSVQETVAAFGVGPLFVKLHGRQSGVDCLLALSVGDGLNWLEGWNVSRLQDDVSVLISHLHVW